MRKHNILKVALWVVPILALLLAIIFPNKGWAYIINTVLVLAELVILVFNFKREDNTISVLLVTILCFMLLTWLIPAAYFSSSYVEQGRIRMGLFDLMNYPVTAISYFGYIAAFALAIGAFYGVLNKVPAYRTFLEKFAKLAKGTEKFFLFIIMLVLAVLTSLGGMQLALLALFPLLVSLILLMGFDKIVAAMTLVGSTMVGIAGTTYGVKNISTIATALGVGTSSEVITKVVILILGLTLLIFNVILYDKRQKKTISELSKEIKKKEIKVEKTTSKTTKSSKKEKATKAAVKEEKVVIVKEQPKVKEENSEYLPAANKSGKHAIWPFVVGFSLMFVLIILAFMPWIDGFGVKAFDSATSAVVDFKLFDFAIFGSLLGTVNAFGYWSIIDLTVVLLFILVLLAIIYKVKLSDVLDGAMDGIRKALPIALIIILVYTCLVITTYHPFQLEVYKALFGSATKFNFGTALPISLSAIFAGIFNSEASYAFQSVLPYLASVLTDTASYSAIAVLFQAFYGFTMIFAPTSLILMVVLKYLGISYSKWLKTIWKFLLEFLAVILVVLAVIILI